MPLSETSKVLPSNGLDILEDTKYIFTHDSTWKQCSIDDLHLTVKQLSICEDDEQI